MKSLARNSLIVLTILGGMYTGLANAQSLQFSKVHIVGTTEDTVPSGKVWKVEAYWQARTSVDQTFTTSCNSDFDHHPIYINGDYFFQFLSSPGTGNTSLFTGVGNKLPLWLPAGYTLKTTCGNDFLSIIEFDVGP